MTAVPVPPGSADAGMVWHHGDPFGEQRRLASGNGVVELVDRGIVTVTGPDRLSWLNDLTTQLVTELQPGDSALALILSPHGHVEHELHLVDDGATTWIVVERADVQPLIEYLRRMQFMLRVEIADATDSHGVLWAAGPAGAGELAWRVPEPFASRGFQGRELILATGDLDARSAELGEPAGAWALEALRVAALMPRIGRDTDHKTIPNEVGWLAGEGAPNAVHLRKGCYRGQETVAKVHNLGRPPRKLVLLDLDGSTEHPAAHCDRVFLDGKEVGWIGTGAQHHEDGSIATAMLKRNAPDDAELTVAHADGHESRATASR